MGIIIGIDVGISTTKIVGLRDGQPSNPIRTTAADPIASLYGAFGKYRNDISFGDSKRKHTQKTLCVSTSVAVFDPDRAAERIGFLTVLVASSLPPSPVSKIR